VWESVLFHRRSCYLVYDVRYFCFLAVCVSPAALSRLLYSSASRCVFFIILHAIPIIGPIPMKMSRVISYRTVSMSGYQFLSCVARLTQPECSTLLSLLRRGRSTGCGFDIHVCLRCTFAAESLDESGRNWSVR